MTVPDQQDNTYLFDSESAAEMGRLILQDRIITDAMGGLFPERGNSDLAGVRHILDIGCGPGGWALSVAENYSHTQVVGIDISELMISYSRVQAAREGLRNVRFEVMNALEPLRFADNSFDIVNLRTALAYIPRTVWPEVVRECVRVVRPGGTVRLSEFDSFGLTNSKAFEEGKAPAARVFHQRGLGFSPADSATVGITFMLGRFLSDAGCATVKYYPHVIDFSYGSKFHGSQLQNITVIYNQALEALQKSAVPAFVILDMQRRYEQQMTDMQSQDFRALQYWLTACGEKATGGT